MNGKLHAAPLAGELLQIAGVLIITTTAVGLAMLHHWTAAVALGVGLVAYAAGHWFRNHRF